MVAGRPATKAGTLVAPGDAVVLGAPARRFVSRGGEKLEAALDRFGVVVSGRRALDAGASTGGFTHCLISHGAEHVVAVDVGYGQLDWRLRQHPRVTVLERTNVRDLTAAELPYRPDLVVADLSFISLGLTLPALVATASEGAEFVVLAKPQFEAGRAEVGPGGVVTDPVVWRRVLRRIWDLWGELGPTPIGAMASPLLGPAGNVEFFVLARSGASPPDGSAEGAIEAAVEEGLAVRSGAAAASSAGP